MIPGRSSNDARIIWSIFLIGMGVLLFLDNIDLLPFDHPTRLWPLALIGFGLLRLRRVSEATARLFSIVVMFVGALLLLSNFHLIHSRKGDLSWPFSILLIAAGVVMLMKMLDTNPSRANGGIGRYFVSPAVPYSPDVMNDLVIFGSVRRKMESLNFQGGNGLSVFGNLEIDLRRAHMPVSGQVLNLSGLFGAIKVRVPETWRLNIAGVGILGAYEDKTLPPNIGAAAPVLTVTGYAVFASVEIVD